MSAAEIVVQLDAQFGPSGSREALRRYDKKLRTLGRMAAGPYLVAAIQLLPTLSSTATRAIRLCLSVSTFRSQTLLDTPKRRRRNRDANAASHH